MNDAVTLPGTRARACARTSRAAHRAIWLGGLAITAVIVAALAFTRQLESHDPLITWLEHWEVARGCLVPDTSYDTATALKVEELSGRHSCAQELRDLWWSLAPSERTGEVAQHWEAAMHAIEVVAGPASSERAVAVEDADLEVAELRRLAGLEAVADRPLRGTVSLPALGKGLVMPFEEGLTIRSAVSFNAGLLSGSSTDHPGWVGYFEASALDGQFDKVLDQVSENVIRSPYVLARPAQMWNVGQEGPDLEPNELVIDDAGGTRERIQLPRPCKIIAALNRGRERLIFLETLGAREHTHLVAISPVRGRGWEILGGNDPRRLIGASQDLMTGTVDLIVQDTRGVRLLRYSQERSASEGGEVEIELTGARKRDARELLYFQCRHHDTSWTMGEGVVQRYGTSGFESEVMHGRSSDEDQIDCRDETALVLRRSPDVLERCRAGRCSTVLKPKHDVRGAAALFDDQTWIYAAALNGVVGVWREGASPTFYTVDHGYELKAITVLSGIPYLAMVTKDGTYRFVALPAKS